MLKQMFASAALVVLGSTGVHAAAPQCKGDLATIRISTIKPGQMDRFRKAVTNHQTWLRAHGGGSVQLLPVYRFDPKGRQQVASEVEALTITRRGGESRDSADAAYRAFVADYQASSKIKSDVRTCLPRN